MVLNEMSIFSSLPRDQNANAKNIFFMLLFETLWKTFSPSMMGHIKSIIANAASVLFFFLICNTADSALYGLAYLVLTNPRRGSYYSCHFTDEQTETQRGRLTFPKSHSWRMTEPGFRLYSLTLEHSLLTSIMSPLTCVKYSHSTPVSHLHQKLAMFLLVLYGSLSLRWRLSLSPLHTD